MENVTNLGFKRLGIFFELSPKMVLLIGTFLGLFIGYVAGVVRGIIRVIKVIQNEDVFLPTGELKFDKIER
ncbi:hypothetical protein [Clostridium sp. FP1]|uniref:hypothetical protein n=1 Tax=Clostridium sp. FP1 TaxID=2724076 RepID=UPI0016524C1E|nr:hypothetical protein [Clostridium sp. FP1]MBZ9633666.1 hypothetical protein [Clostridium sp. FP1]